jgi:hypothetical protein
MNIPLPKIGAHHRQPPKHKTAILLKAAVTMFIKFQAFMETASRNKTELSVP